MFEKKVSVEKASAILKPVSPYSIFKLHKGRELRSLQDLHDSLTEMENEVFYHHVSRGKNDFANWVRDIIGDEDFAKKIRKVKHKYQLKELINKRIRELQYQINKEAERQRKLIKTQPLPPKKDEAILQHQNIPPLHIIPHHHVPMPQSADPFKELLQDNTYLKHKIEELAQKEREVSIREKKILEIENRIEKDLSRSAPGKIFTKEFIQGILVGLLIFLVAMLVYIKLTGKMNLL